MTAKEGKEVEQDFYRKYNSVLQLSGTNWSFSKFGNRQGAKISVSGRFEIKKDYIYYDFRGLIYKLDLTKDGLRERILKVLKEKKSDGDIEFSELTNRKNDMVILPRSYAQLVCSKEPSLTSTVEQTYKKDTTPEIIGKMTTTKLDDVFSGLEKYVSKGTSSPKVTIFSGRSGNGAEIDRVLNTIKDSVQLNQTDVAELFKQLLFLCINKGWKDF